MALLFSSISSVEAPRWYTDAKNWVNSKLKPTAVLPVDALAMPVENPILVRRVAFAAPESSQGGGARRAPSPSVALVSGRSFSSREATGGAGAGSLDSPRHAVRRSSLEESFTLPGFVAQDAPRGLPRRLSSSSSEEPLDVSGFGMTAENRAVLHRLRVQNAREGSAARADFTAAAEHQTAVGDMLSRPLDASRARGPRAGSPGARVGRIQRPSAATLGAFRAVGGAADGIRKNAR